RQLVENRIFQLQSRLNITAGLLVAEDVGDIAGAESPSGPSFLKSCSHRGRTIVTDEGEQLPHLPSQGPVGVGQTAQVLFGNWPEQRDHAMLCGRSLGSRHLSEQLFLETLDAEGMAPPPRAGIANDFLMLVVDGDGRRIRFHDEPAAHVTRRHTVAITVFVSDRTACRWSLTIV